MNSKGLPLTHEMFGIFWVKLFHEASIPLSIDAIREIKTTRLAETGRAPTLYQMRHDAAGVEMWIGPDTVVKGYEPARGYSFEELLLLPFKDNLYAEQWRMIELKPLAKKTRATSPESGIGAAISRGRRSAEDFRADYGSGIMDALAAACAAEAARARAGILTQGSRDERPYSTELSLTATVERLKERYPDLQLYALSTLKAAVTQFVACPRGRPPVKSAKTKGTPA